MVWICSINIIHFLGGPYFAKLCFLNYIFLIFFPIQLNYLSLKYIIQNFHSPKRDYHIYNFSYCNSSFKLLIGYCLLIWIHKIGTVYFSDIPKRLYHIINLIFKIICRKKYTLCLKLNTSPIKMKENNLCNNKENMI